MMCPKGIRNQFPDQTEGKEEEPWNGTQYDKDGNILVEWVNGKGIEQ